MRTLTILFMWLGTLVVALAVICYLVMVALPVFTGIEDLLSVLQERKEILESLAEWVTIRNG